MQTLLTFSLFLLPALDSYKILVYNPKYGHSHSNFMGNLADILAEAGHDVTSLIPIMNERIKDGTTKTTTLYVQPTEEIRKHCQFLMDDSVNFFTTKMFNPIDAYFVGRMMGGLFSKTCSHVLNTPGLMERLENEKYDVAITENFDICGLGIAHVIKPKSIVSGSTSTFFGNMAEEAGVHVISSTNPSIYTDHLDVHSVVSRFWNYIGHFLAKQFFVGVREGIHDIFVEKYGRDFPSFEEINSHVAFTYINAEPLIDYANPTLHRVIEIPAIGAKEPKPLDQHWTDVLNRRSRAVLISFGSIAQSHKLSPEQKTAIIKTISNFPDVTFIWKYEKDDDFSKNEASKVENLVISKWTPQSDLLNHENIVAFISHGGMGSVQETATRGVPAIFVPLFGDQPRNAAMMEHNGLGKVYDKFELHNYKKLTAALKEILEDERYVRRAKHISKMLARKPFSSREVLIKHVEFAAEFGPSTALRPQSHDMNIIEYHNLDIYAISLLILSTVCVVLGKCLLLFLRRLVGVSKKKAD